MSKKLENVVIVGGGTSGWMTAVTFISCLPDINVTLVESPHIPTVGVGESTLGTITNWCKLVGIDDNDFMPHCDANYKFGIRFDNFYKKDSGHFYYPFGEPYTVGNIAGLNDWYFKRLCYPDESPLEDYANCFFQPMSFINQNKISDKIDFNTFKAYQFDATKFGLWLRDNVCIPKGVTHILSEVKDVKQNENGIESLVLEDGKHLHGDLFIDCTGFKSLLLGKALKEPFESLEDILPNNSAWATKIPYKDKESEMVLYTDCCAIDNGWVWSIPLWSRMGSGYVYSDKYISDEDALDQFRSHLVSKGCNDDLEYKNIKMRTGIHERLWVKNVCAIGLSGGFIEPLESGGLFTTHEFLLTLIRILSRGNPSQWDKDAFNFFCRDHFREFSEFVALHYALSHRDDTEYWKDNFNRDYSGRLNNDSRFPSIQGFESSCHQRFRTPYKFREIDSGFHCIATGMHWFPTDIHMLKYANFDSSYDIHARFQPAFFLMEKRKEEWNRIAAMGDSPYKFLKSKYE